MQKEAADQISRLPVSVETARAPKIGAYCGKEESMNPARDLLEAIVDGKEKTAQGILPGFQGGGTASMGGADAPRSLVQSGGEALKPMINTSMGGTNTTMTGGDAPPPPPPATRPVTSGAESFASLLEDVQERAFQSRLHKLAQEEPGIRERLDEIRSRKAGFLPGSLGMGAGWYAGGKLNKAIGEMATRAAHDAGGKPPWYASKRNLATGWSRIPVMDEAGNVARKTVREMRMPFVGRAIGRLGGMSAGLLAAKALFGKPKQGSLKQAGIGSDFADLVQEHPYAAAGIGLGAAGALGGLGYLHHKRVQKEKRTGKPAKFLYPFR